MVTRNRSCARHCGGGESRAEQDDWICQLDVPDNLASFSWQRIQAVLEREPVLVNLRDLARRGFLASLGVGCIDRYIRIGVGWINNIGLLHSPFVGDLGFTWKLLVWSERQFI